jgi:hypothetical protein
MASVVTLSEDKIQELMAGWQAVADRQDALNAEITELKTQVETYQGMLIEFTNLTLPEIEAIVAANSIETEDLKDNAVPNLEVDVDQNTAAIDNIRTVDIPGLLDNVFLIGENMTEIGVPFRQPDPPLDDDPDNPILPGTRWFDEDDSNKEHFWNGTEWVDAMTVPDLSLTVQKFKTSTHQLY